MDFATLLARFTAAVGAGDGAALAALCTGDGVYHDTFYGEFRGRAAIAGMLEERFYGDAERFRWDMERAVSDGHTGYACWNFSYASRLPECRGRRVVAEGMSCLALENGLIRHYGEKFDSGMALVQLDFAPERLARLFRRWNQGLRDKPALRRHFAD
jgi:ketosteroid isomerase-like protein